MFALHLVGQKPVPRCELRCFFNSLSPVPLTFPAYNMAWNSVAVIGLWFDDWYSLCFASGKEGVFVVFY